METEIQYRIRRPLDRWRSFWIHAGDGTPDTGPEAPRMEDGRIANSHSVGRSHRLKLFGYYQASDAFEADVALVEQMTGMRREHQAVVAIEFF
jgi:hypothetical protein